MNQARHLTALDCVRAQTLVDEGRSKRFVARLLNVHHSTISRALERYRITGSHSRRHGQGRKRATNARDDRFLCHIALRNRTATSAQMQNELETARNVHVSALTVRRRLREAGLISRRPIKAPELTRAHKVARLRFARTHENWTIDDWRKVLFSDETRISLKSSDGRQRVYRRRGEREAAFNFVPHEPFGRGSKMFWAGISFNGRTELVSIHARAMNAEFYVENILQEHVMPYAPFIGPDFVFMQDNARPHVARVCIEYLNEVRIEVMNWPARSPDLNPIEHLWDTIKRAVRRYLPAPQNLQQLEYVARHEWENVPQPVIENLIRSMPRRIQAVIRAGGGNTTY